MKRPNNRFKIGFLPLVVSPEHCPPREALITSRNPFYLVSAKIPMTIAAIGRQPEMDLPDKVSTTMARPFVPSEVVKNHSLV